MARRPVGGAASVAHPLLDNGKNDSPPAAHRPGSGPVGCGSYQTRYWENSWLCLQHVAGKLSVAHNGHGAAIVRMAGHRHGRRTDHKIDMGIRLVDAQRGELLFAFAGAPFDTLR